MTNEVTATAAALSWQLYFPALIAIFLFLLVCL